MYTYSNKSLNNYLRQIEINFKYNLHKTLIPILLKMLNTNLLARLCHNALKSDVCSRHSAAITKGGKKVVATGYNNSRTCFSSNTVCAQHAETAAVMDLLSQHSAKHYLKMVPNGKWCFLRTRTTKEAFKKVQNLCYPLE